MAKKKVFQISNALTEGLEETVSAAHNYSGELRVEAISLKKIEMDPENPRDLILTFDDLIERDARGGRRRCISGYTHASKCVLHRDSFRRQRVDNSRELHDLINFIFLTRPEAPSQFVES